MTQPEPDSFENPWRLGIMEPPCQISPHGCIYSQLLNFHFRTPDGKDHLLGKANEYHTLNMGSILGSGLFLSPVDGTFIGNYKNQGTVTVTTMPLSMYLPKDMPEELRDIWTPLWERFAGMIRICGEGTCSGSFGSSKHVFTMKSPTFKQKFVGEEEKVTLPDDGVNHGLPPKQRSGGYDDGVFWAFVAPAEEGNHFSDGDKKACEECIEKFANSVDPKISKLSDFLSFFCHGGFKYMVHKRIATGYISIETLANCSIRITPIPGQLPITINVSVKLPCSILPRSKTCPVTIPGISARGPMFKHFGICSTANADDLCILQTSAVRGLLYCEMVFHSSSWWFCLLW